MKRTTRLSRWRPVAAVAGLGVVMGLTVAVAPVHAPAARADAAGKGGDFVPFATPGRLLDTRNGTGGITNTLSPGSKNAFPVLGHAGVPAAGVRAVLLNVATVTPAAATYLTLWPDGTPRPTVSMINVEAGQTISNTAVVAPGADGKIAIYNGGASTDAVVDVEGYFTEASTTGGPGAFVPVDQTRLLDTRHGIGAPTGQIPPLGSLTVPLNVAPVATDATAVFVNALVPGASVGAYVSAFPAGGTDGLPMVNIIPGNTASGAALKLGLDGSVTFVNHTGQPVDLVLDVQGYFTASSAQGAGLRVTTARLLNTTKTGTAIPANGTVDIQVGGAYGLPTRSVAGAVLDITSFDQTAPTGFLRAWPTGEPEPSTSLDNFTATSIRSDNVIVKPGLNGKISVHNVSGGTIDLVVDLQGWFADPLPALPLSQFAPTVAVQASPTESQSAGSIEYAYVDNDGRLLVGHQDSAQNFATVTWSVISDVSTAFTGRPSLAEQPDKNMQVVGHTTDSNVSVSTETAREPVPVWGPWAQVGGSMTSRPVITRLGDGRSVIFAVDTDGQLWALPQDSVNGPYTTWQPLGDADLVGAPTVVPAGTNIQVFALDNTGALKTAVYFGDGVLSGWTSVGGTGLTGSPAVVVHPGLRLQVFVRAADGSVQTKAQDTSHTWPAAWDTIAGLTAAGSPAAILDPVTGKTEVVARSVDPSGPDKTTIYHVEGTAQSWGIWEVESATVGIAMTDPTVFPFTNSHGPGWALITRASDDTNKVVTHQPATTGATAFTLPAPPS